MPEKAKESDPKPPATKVDAKKEEPKEQAKTQKSIFDAKSTTPKFGVGSSMEKDKEKEVKPLQFGQAKSQGMFGNPNFFSTTAGQPA